MQCNRTACKVELDHGHYRIWNDPSKTEPNLYCIGCGFNITYFNPSLKYEKVRREVNPEVCVMCGDYFDYQGGRQACPKCRRL